MENSLKALDKLPLQYKFDTLEHESLRQLTEAHEEAQRKDDTIAQLERNKGLLERRSSNGELTRREKAWFAQEKRRSKQSHATQFWQPPVELSAKEEQVVKRVRKAKLFVFLREYRHQIFDEAFQQELAALYQDSKQRAAADRTSPTGACNDFSGIYGSI